MKQILSSLVVFIGLCSAAGAAFTSCGPGYVLAKHADIDGMHAQECQKLWCVDLETGKSMGSGKNAANGYRATVAPVELCDAEKNCIECYGERKWCGGEIEGIWNPEYGAYTRGGADTATYLSYQKGGCFAWRLEMPTCPEGQKAVLLDGEWHCSNASGSGNASRASSIRRTGTLRRSVR